MRDVLDSEIGAAQVGASRAEAVCRVCDNQSQAKEHFFRAPEVMFGTGETFEYVQCPKCGSMNITQLPDELWRYYPKQYYSFEARKPGMAQALKAAVRNAVAVYGPPALFSGRPWYEVGSLKSLRDAKVTRSMRILDLGCGAGHLIRSLRDIGFRHVSGADPFIDADIAHPNGTRVSKANIAELSGPYDVVMMHHSLEHIWDQQGTVQAIHRVLAPGGRCIIRIPTIDCYAWSEYGADWVQFDAPRHLTLHSRRSITDLLSRAGFEITAVIDDSSSFHLLGSEKIRRGHSLVDTETGAIDYAKSVPAEFIATAAARTAELNRNGLGDSIAVHARK